MTTRGGSDIEGGGVIGVDLTVSERAAMLELLGLLLAEVTEYYGRQASHESSKTK